MKLRYEAEPGGLVWVNNPMVVVTTWNTRRWVRALTVLPLAYVVGGFTFGQVPPFEGPLDPLYMVAFLVVAIVYLRRPRTSDPSYPKRVGFTRAEVIMERLGGEVLRFPWASLIDIRPRLGPGTKMGVELTFVTAAGETHFVPCNLDFAFTVLWARSLASSTGLDPAVIPVPPESGASATDFTGTGRRIQSDPPLMLMEGSLQVLKRGRLREFALVDVDFIPVFILGQDVMSVAARGRQIATIGDEAEMAAFKAWFRALPSPKAP